MDATDLRLACARCMCVGFHGHHVDDALADMLDRGVGGVILFARNVQSREQVRELCLDIKRRARGLVYIGVDQEGGRVQRLVDGFTAIPSMRDVGRQGPTAAGRWGRAIARELRSVHIDLDFAPVVDVDSNPANPVIGERSFGTDPGTVSACAVEFIQMMQLMGVGACAKHFPGHGDTNKDSHHDLPVLPHTMERLGLTELPPFAASIQAGVASIMTAHVLFEALDPGVPATLSRRVVQGMLRDELGYDGMVFTDDLEMKAVADRWPLGEAAVLALGAGVDVALVCHEHARQVEVHESLVRAAESGALEPARVHEAARRVRRFMQRFVR
jgi:beta-N-acetylhexosaminidase